MEKELPYKLRDIPLAIIYLVCSDTVGVVWLKSRAEGVHK
jgi:hypothetical protein